MTLPTGRSRSSAAARCRSVANEPGEITDIASSTSTGVFDITRTTGTSTGKCRSMYDVVIPAATEMTSCDWPTHAAISPSILAMSCGLTVITSVLAFLAASSAVTTGTP
jgi:hypothetical protein